MTLTREQILELFKQDIDDVVDWSYYVKQEEMDEAVDILLSVITDQKRPFMEKYHAIQAAAGLAADAQNRARIGEARRIVWPHKKGRMLLSAILDTMESSDDREMREHCAHSIRSILWAKGIDLINLE